MNTMLGVSLFAIAISAALVLASRRESPGMMFVLTAAPYLLGISAFLLVARLPINDSFHFHFPVFEYIGQALADGPAFPEWLPVGGGVRTGVLQISLLYFLPHRLAGYALYAWTPLSAAEAYKIQYVLGVLLLTWGWWLFLTRLTGSRLAASFGAITLALGGVGITFHQEQVLATTYLVPWFLLAAWQVEKDRRFLFAVALMFGLAGTLHYPHILLFSFIVFFTIYLLFRPGATLSKLRAGLSFWLVPCIALFVIALAPLLYVYVRLPELASPIRSMFGAGMMNDTFEDYLRMTAGTQPFASATPRQLVEYLAPHFPPPRADDAGFFVGRPALALCLMACLLDPRRASPLLLMAFVFALLALGIHSPAPFVDVLFRLSPEVMGMFRQWYHFYPMLNFCLSALAAIGLAAALGRLRGVLGRAGPPLLVAVFALQITELSIYAQHYIQGLTVEDTPPRLLDGPPDEAAEWGISSRRTLLQYTERAAVEGCCAAALRDGPYLTVDVVSVDGGFQPQMAALEQGTGGRIPAAVPQDVLDAWLEPAGAEAGAGSVEMAYRPDGVDLDVTAAGPALLVMPINHALGLEARLDGEVARVWRVNAALSGVLVPPGESRVEVRVVPDGYGWIAAIQVVCVLTLFGLLAPALWRQRAAAPARSPPPD
jgi:hypothetical protein